MGAPVPVVLRLVERALDEGRIAGEVEMVETGARAVVRDAGELVAFVNSQRHLGPGQGHLLHRVQDQVPDQGA